MDPSAAQQVFLAHHSEIPDEKHILGAMPTELCAVIEIATLSPKPETANLSTLTP